MICTPLQVLTGAGQVLGALDHTFKLELAWLTTNAEQQLEKAVHKKILACMPTQSASISFQQTLQKLDDFINSRMGKMVARSSQAEATTCRAVVERLRTGTYTPDSALANAGGVYGKFYDRLGCFCRAPKSGKDGGELVGKPALAANMQCLQEKLLSKKRSPTLQEIDSLKPFSYLMDDSQHKLMAKWGQEALAGLAKGASATTASIAATGSDGKASIKSKPSVLSFFG
jgi:hypothetical protein